MIPMPAVTNIKGTQSIPETLYWGLIRGRLVLVSNSIPIKNIAPVIMRIKPGFLSTGPRDMPITVPANIIEGAPEIDIIWISKAPGSVATSGPLPSGPIRNV